MHWCPLLLTSRSFRSVLLTWRLLAGTHGIMHNSSVYLMSLSVHGVDIGIR
ncbi:hypothetical protein M758_3G157600 [Ceratodon purpureus]|nr:hypothetical protein M758_3G157600 [Ceratodon purpureus]